MLLRRSNQGLFSAHLSCQKNFRSNASAHSESRQKLFFRRTGLKGHFGGGALIRRLLTSDGERLGEASIPICPKRFGYAFNRGRCGRLLCFRLASGNAARDRQGKQNAPHVNPRPNKNITTTALALTSIGDLSGDRHGFHWEALATEMLSERLAM
jgi:hypothetical protein